MPRPKQYLLLSLAETYGKMTTYISLLVLAGMDEIYIHGSPVSSSAEKEMRQFQQLACSSWKLLECRSSRGIFPMGYDNLVDSVLLVAFGEYSESDQRNGYTYSEGTLGWTVSSRLPNNSSWTRVSSYHEVRGKDCIWNGGWGVLLLSTTCP